jgi:Uncharacterised nucleotidyltransferase
VCSTIGPEHERGQSSTRQTFTVTRTPAAIRRRRAPGLLALLAAAQRKCRTLALASLDERQIHWAVTTGLGPLVVWTTAEDPEASASSQWTLLRAADIAARVLVAEQFDAVTELIDACTGAIPPLTLLKGISVSEGYYPSPHLRPMRDIDVLVPKSAVQPVEVMLRRLGYREQVGVRVEDFQHLHHGVPMVHRRTGVCIEVHHQLFPPSPRIRGCDPFSPEHIAAKLVPSTFIGRSVYRLDPQLELPYIASHWAQSSKVIHGVGGMFAMLDTIYLLKRNPELHWDNVLRYVHGSPASTHLYLLLSYLARNELVDVPPELIDELARMQQSLGRLARDTLYTILDRYVVDGQQYGRYVTRRSNVRIAWDALLAPGSPSRNLAILPLHLVWCRLWRLSTLYAALRSWIVHAASVCYRLGRRVLQRAVIARPPTLRAKQ